MTLRKRLARLEARRGIGADPPTIRHIIFAAAWREGDGVRAEPEAAMLRELDGWCTILRCAGERKTAFLDRINRRLQGDATIEEKLDNEFLWCQPEQVCERK